MEYLSTDDKIASYSEGRNRKYAKNSPRCYPTQAQIVVTRRLMENLGSMQLLINRLGKFSRNPFNFNQILHAGRGHPLQAAKLLQ
jgi:hypothetical protein